MKQKIILSSLAFALASGFAFNAFAQTKADILVKQRQAAMTLQAKYLGPLGGMAAGRVPFDLAVVTRNATYLETLTKLAWDGFNPSTSGEKSAALPVVYSDAAKFKQASDQLQTEVGKLVTASKGGNEADIKAAIGAVGKACGNCHDNFRAKS